MFSGITPIETTEMTTGAWNLFTGLGQPLLYPLGAITFFGLTMFVAIAGFKSVISR